MNVDKNHDKFKKLIYDEKFEEAAQCLVDTFEELNEKFSSLDAKNLGNLFSIIFMRGMKKGINKANNTISETTKTVKALNPKIGEILEMDIKGTQIFADAL